MERSPRHPDLPELYQHAACGLACTTDDGLLLVVNETLCQWLGRLAEDLVGKVKLQELLTMGGRIFHQTHWAPLLRMQGSISEVKLEVIHAGGARIPMVMNAVRREAGGAFFHEVSFIVARDRDAYERELVASRAKLQALVEEATKLHSAAKDRALFAEQMVGIVSHDLRNPLSTIQMGAALLARPGTDLQAVLPRINRASDRALRLISDLLDFTQARLGAGIAVARTPLDLRGCVGNAVDELALAYPGRALEHRHSGDWQCKADGDRLAQLVGNLVSNAIAYGREDAPILISSEVQEEVAAVTVRNWGDPIPPELLKHLFEPMVRGDVEATGRSIGLGLYIVSEITKAHGGAMAVESTLADGTAFTATFPAQANARAGD